MMVTTKAITKKMRGINTMKIKLSLNEKEVKEIIKEYALKEFPINTKNKEIYITELYSGCTIEIEEKVEPNEKANSEE